MSDYEEMISRLEETGKYRVLRRIQPRAFINRPDGSGRYRGLFVDVETTGLSFIDNEIIELAMVPFNYGLDGRIFEILEPFQSFEEPSHPIPEEITKITGIDQSMVTGQRIDRDAVKKLVSEANIIIAHNASFDRKFLERLMPCFAEKPWACSATQINWREEGFEGRRLGYLVAMAGYFYDRHRALNDCYAAIELLSKPLPESGETGFARLLTEARAPTFRIWAMHAPYDLKDHLKRRGYRWSSGDDGTIRAWRVDVSQDQKDEEIEYLQKEIFGREAPIPVTEIDAYNRFSRRAE